MLVALLIYITPPVTYRMYIASGNHLHWAPSPHPHKSTKQIALEAFMISHNHGRHLTKFALNGCHVPLPLIAKCIQQPLGELHNVLTNPIQDLSTSMDYPYCWV
jgi:hypothetical protein